MKRISFFVSTINIRDNLDYSDYFKSNPGMGATQYLFLFLAQHLSQEGYNVTFFCDKLLPIPDLQVNLVKDIFSAIDEHIRLGNDIFITRTSDDSSLNRYIANKNIKVIFWSHNRLWKSSCDSIANNDNIIANVCVSQHQAFSIINHPSSKKTTVIYNPCNYCTMNDNTVNNVASKKNNVVFMGTLDKARGLHVVAKAWPKVVKKIPDACLYVIGGNLYNSSQNGNIEFHETNFGKKVIKYFGDSISNVVFTGILGKEKTSYFLNSKLAILNPCGYEALPVTGIEFAAHGLPIITVNKFGQKEVVANGYNGLFARGYKDLANKIILLLKNDNLCSNYSHNAIKYVHGKFDVDYFVADWKNVIDGNIKIYSEPKEFTMNFSRSEKYSKFVWYLRKYKIYIPSYFDLQNAIRKIKNILLRKKNKF